MGPGQVIFTDITLREAINMLYFNNNINRNTFCSVNEYLNDRKYHHFFHVLANQGYKFKGINNRFIKDPNDSFNISVSGNRVIHEQSKLNCKSIW